MCYVHTLNICHYAVHEVSVMDGRLQIGTVNFHAHALNLNNLLVPYLVLGVQICCLELYTSYGVGNMYDKFQGCTVDVQATTGF